MIIMNINMNMEVTVEEYLPLTLIDPAKIPEIVPVIEGLLRRVGSLSDDGKVDVIYLELMMQVLLKSDELKSALWPEIHAVEDRKQAA